VEIEQSEDSLLGEDLLGAGDTSQVGLVVGGLTRGRRRVWLQAVVDDPQPDRVEAVAPQPASVVSAEPAITLNVYVFAEPGGGVGPGEALAEMIDGEVYYSVAAVNGRLLGVVIADATSADDRLLADTVIGAFAGTE
jgi:hypothetical protein